MAKTPEAKVRDPVVDYANRKGIRSIRMYFGPGIQTGWPDDLFLLDGGRPFFIEFKAPGKKTTPKQDKKLAILLKAGYSWVVIDNVEDGKKVIDHYLKNGAHL